MGDSLQCLCLAQHSDCYLIHAKPLHATFYAAEHYHKEVLRRLSAARQLLPESADASGSSLKPCCAGEHVTVMWLFSISDSQNTSLCSIMLPCPSTNLELSCCQTLCLSEKHVGSAEPAASAAAPQQQPASPAQPHSPLQPECGLGAGTASPHVQTREHGEDAAQLHVAKDEDVKGIQDAATASPTVGLLPDRVPAHLNILCTYAIVMQVSLIIFCSLTSVPVSGRFFVGY